MRTHRDPKIRGAVRVSRSPISEGRFGRMFRRLPPAPELGDERLRELAESMRGAEAPTWGGTAGEGDNPDIPAAYTYLGQFIDHDITFDAASSLQQKNDPDALVNFRSPRFDLDSLYGSGPVDEPFQYERDGVHLLIEENDRGELDLPRSSTGIAVIGDPRNDENTIVSQLHLAMAKLHNKFADEVAAEGLADPELVFAEAQRRTRWHYQWVVVFDFIPRIVGEDVFKAVAKRDDEGRIADVTRPHYRVKNNAYMPIEFSAAAYRYGHSQIRGIYDLNASVTARPIFAPGDVGELDDLRGFRPLPKQWSVEWSRFVSIGNSEPQLSRLVDTKLVGALFDLPGFDDSQSSLAFRNLTRGEAMCLPSGQDVARLMKVEPLSEADLDGAPVPTPLWFYLLREAEVAAGGKHLGPVGGKIVAEVLLGLFELDPQSFLSEDPSWHPTIPVAGDGLELSDLIAFAQS